MNRRELIFGALALGLFGKNEALSMVLNPELPDEYVVREYQYGYDAMEALYQAHKNDINVLNTLDIDNVTPEGRMDINVYQVTLKDRESGLAMVPHIIECGDTAIMRIPSMFYTSYTREIYDRTSLTDTSEYAIM